MSAITKDAHVRVSDASPRGWTGMVASVTTGYIVVAHDSNPAHRETVELSRRRVEVLA
jgi:hypothetical protein